MTLDEYTGDIGDKVSEAAEYLENNGNRVEGYLAFSPPTDRDFSEGDNPEEAIIEETNLNQLTVAFDVYPDGVQHPDASCIVKYHVLTDSFNVNEAIGPRSVIEEDMDGIEELVQTEPEEMTSGYARDLFDRGDFSGVFEMDRMTARIERQLIDGGYDVIIGDGKEDGDLLSQPVSEFP
ncbi:MAG: hypothetical protein ABEJ56_02400 [Candidatus Nanohaloarchaea archaeon]